MILHGGAGSRPRPDSERDNRCEEMHEERMQTGRRMVDAGAALSLRRTGKAPLGKPAFQPYWENPPYGMIGGSRKRRHHSKPGPRLDPTRLPLPVLSDFDEVQNGSLQPLTDPRRCDILARVKSLFVALGNAAALPLAARAAGSYAADRFTRPAANSLHARPDIQRRGRGHDSSGFDL